MATPKASNRYPRRGERLAPSTLREFLSEPVPREHLPGRGDAELMLCDLDERAWRRFPEAALTELGKRIIDRVAKSQVRRAFRDRHFPRPAAGLRLDELRLESRTRRCLAREGFDEDLEGLGD